MLLKSIPTSHGAACLIDLSKPQTHTTDVPKMWGVVLYGRCDRVSLLTVALNIKSAAWIADYMFIKKVAIVVWSIDPSVPIETEVVFDSTLARDAVCPACNSTQYVLNGKAGYRCKDCKKQWKPESISRGGKRVNAGRKSKSRGQKNEQGNRQT